jgi:TonB family protein
MKTTLGAAVLLLASCLQGQVAIVVSPRGLTLSADEIRAAERRVSSTPFDLDARLQLIQLYNGAASGDSQYRLPRFDQIRWLAEQRPAEDVFSFATYVGRAGGFYPNGDDHEAMASLWQSQANRLFDDSRVVTNALRFLSVERKDLAESLFVRAMDARPEDVELRARLGIFYATGFAGADFPDGQVVTLIQKTQRDEWAAHCRQALDASRDARVLVGASVALPNVAMRRTGGGSEYEAAVRYSEELLRRAETLEHVTGMPFEVQLYATEAHLSSGTRLPPFVSPPPHSRIRVAGPVQMANIASNVAPVYPELARQAHVQGSVRFEAVIDETGRIQDLKLLTGHPLLVMAAMNAVNQWVFKPTLLNGAPVAVITTLEVPFVLP